MNSERTILLFGEENYQKLKKAKILIFGLGGVGGSAFECLLRHGILNFTIVDYDVVNSSNLNRQILYTLKDINKLKVEAAKERALLINTDVNIEALNLKFTPLTNLDFSAFDFIIDCIDDITAKIEIIKRAILCNIPLITSMGMGNRFDPSKIMISTLDKTSEDPLARKIRTILRKEKIDLKRVNCVFSKETPLAYQEVIASSYVCPNTAGIYMGSYVINYLINNEGAKHEKDYRDCEIIKNTD